MGTKMISLLHFPRQQSIRFWSESIFSCCTLGSVLMTMQLTLKVAAGRTAFPRLEGRSSWTCRRRLQRRRRGGSARWGNAYDIGWLRVGGFEIRRRPSCAGNCFDDRPPGYYPPPAHF